MASVSTKAQPIKDYIRGDSRVLNIQVNQSDGVTPFNLTGCEVFFTVKANSNDTSDTDTSAVIALKTSSFSNPASGLATLTITNAISQDIAPGVYFYDVQLKDSFGNITSLGQNTFTINADITRAIS